MLCISEVLFLRFREIVGLGMLSFPLGKMRWNDDESFRDFVYKMEKKKQ